MSMTRLRYFTARLGAMAETASTMRWVRSPTMLDASRSATVMPRSRYSSAFSVLALAQVLLGDVDLPLRVEQG